MKSYTVHAPPGEPSAPERFAFVKDGFSWPALLLPIVWILWHRLWLTLMGYIIFMLLLAWTERLTSQSIATTLAVLGAVLLALEANNIRRLSLAQRGWRELGGVTGQDLEEAEIRFFTSWTKGGAAGSSHPPKAFSRPDDPDASIPHDEPIFGLFPEPGTVNVVIVDYGSGNLHSAAKAFERAARETGHHILVTDDPDAVAQAERIVLPGVGAFADCRRGLDAVPGMVEALNEQVMRRGKPFLGICVGCQLMAERGLEKETVPGLGWIAGDVVQIEPADPALKIPHMGWNSLHVVRDHPILAGVPTGEDGLDAYFVHSYHLRTADEADVLARADYGGPVTAIVGRENLAGTQFHPEKSQALGQALIGNFLRWRP